MKYEIKKGAYILVETDKDCSIGLFKEDNSCSCYFIRPGYPMRYMFGLSLDETINTVIETCVANIRNFLED